MLSVKNVSKRYKRRIVLNDVSFDVPQGTVCGLLGLNGAGKTTLLKIITGLAFADCGSVAVKDNKKIGFMIEQPEFFGELTGKQNLTLLAIMQGGVSDNAVDEALKTTGLMAKADVKVNEYSLGMRQRLYLAFAMQAKPDVLILDEPFNGLDPLGITMVKNIITDFAGRGGTVIVSAHVISELIKICDFALIIDKGEIVRRVGKDEMELLDKAFVDSVHSGDMQ